MIYWINNLFILLSLSDLLINVFILSDGLDFIIKDICKC